MYTIRLSRYIRKCAGLNVNIKRLNHHKDFVRIGCASGFWGDTAVAAPQLIHLGNIDFLVFDYLSEITMSLLTAAKSKSPEMGYAPDFLHTSLVPSLASIKSKNIRVISNAGGINPHSCAEAIRQAAANQSIDINVAVVTGDDLLSQPHLLKEVTDKKVQDIDSGLSLPKSITSMNAYLGAGPIARALDLGADIVVTGRCADSALVLAPLIHQFKWSMDDHSLMAAGSLAGHLVECGAQVTGGIFTDWEKVPAWDKIGFPIVQCHPSGEFIVTKPKRTGGIINAGTVSEQLLYEIGDPQHYVLPDVDCDFSNVTLHGLKLDNDPAILVKGARGLPPSDQYKVSATYADGYRTTGVCVIGGPKAVEKSNKTIDAILSRCRDMFKFLGLADFTNVHREIIGSEDRYGKNATITEPAREAVIWISATHPDKKALEILSRELAPAGTGMAPGLTGIVGGRPKVSPVLRLFSFLHDKSKFKIDIFMNGEHQETYNSDSYMNVNVSRNEETEMKETVLDDAPLETGSCSYRLEELAYTRSGDKGNSANIGVIARHPALVPYLKRALTSESIYDYFQHLFEESSSSKNVMRYDVPGINALNFLLIDVLGGGGVASLRSDPQGKAFGQMLLDFELENMPPLEKICKPVKLKT